jgi:nucleotide-binding universal stress UspA family protein
LTSGLLFAQEQIQKQHNAKGGKRALIYPPSFFGTKGAAEPMNKILLAIDDSPASSKAASYVADLAGRKKEFGIHIFHAIDPLPTELQEFRGAENPHDEKILDAELKRKQNSWEQKAKTAAESLITKTRLLLEEAGLPPEHISSQNVVLMHHEDLTDDILKAARDFNCNTVVVGRNAFPWLEELFASHLGDEVERKAEGIFVSVID